MSAARSLERIAEVLEETRARNRELERERRLGHRSQPRPFTAALALTAFPALAREFKPVPDEFVDGERVVSCPCGNSHPSTLGELHGAPCGRWFIGTHGAVLVYREPVEVAA